jgi:hypothetical protein
MKSFSMRSGLLGLVVLLALTGFGGGALAAGDLFDDAYRDCPHKTRFRDGQIDDLAVNRDADDEDHVNVSWAATDPATWGLGPNAYRTSLVVILDDNDGDPVAKTLSLGSTKTTFEGIKTGTEVTVQLAIVVDTAEGDYLISDILAKSIHQSLTAPAFSGPWYRTRTGGSSLSITLGGTTISDVAPDIRLRDLKKDGASPLAGTELAASLKKYDDVLKEKDFQYDSERVANGRMYYIGYNENFANYRPGTANPAAYSHSPSTPRLRIGLAHSFKEDKDARDDVDFDAYIIRIEDADGDVVQEGDDVATVATNYGTAATAYIWDTDGRATSGTAGTQGFKTAARKLFVYDLDRMPTFNTQKKETTPALQNVRIVDGSDIAVGMHRTGVPRANTGVRPASLSIVKVGVSEVAPILLEPFLRPADIGPNPPTEIGSKLNVGEVYANPPDEHRDFPTDTLNSDKTYTITAWAVNEDDEVISPVATLNLHPVNKTVTLGTGTAGLRDYLNPSAITSGTLIVTEFTVLK